MDETDLNAPDFQAPHFEGPDFRALARAAAAFIDLPIDDAYFDEVVRNLALLHGHAAQITYFPLAAEEEPAPVFRP